MAVQYNVDHFQVNILLRFPLFSHSVASTRFILDAVYDVPFFLRSEVNSFQ